MGATSSTGCCLKSNQNIMSRRKLLSDLPNLFTSPPPASEVPDVESGMRDHTVLFQVPLCDLKSTPVPFPSVYDDKWDADHVKMPCSPNNLYQGKSILEQNWSLIVNAYKNKMSDSIELERAISTYSKKTLNLDGLHTFVNDDITKKEQIQFFNHTLPGIISLALRLPELVTQPPLLLSRQKAHSISLSQLQIASLLANAFLCTFPHRNTDINRSELANYPDINFFGLLRNTKKFRHVSEKLKCILNYFNRVISKEPTGTVTITRLVLKESEFPNWEVAQETLGGLFVSSKGTIEKEGDGLLQMDFADPFIGGQVLKWGCVQEEILFVIRPELIVSCLFTERIEDNEALLITGCEQYSRYSGYSRTFRFEGDYIDTTPRDTFGRRLSQIVAIDATPYSYPATQYEEKAFLRELNKAYAGFHSREEGKVPLAAVATGNWGCGIFNGDPRLKSLIQLMAAAVTGRDVAYFTFGDERLRDDVYDMHKMLLEERITVGMLYKILSKYCEEFSAGMNLYGYIRIALLEKHCDR